MSNNNLLLTESKLENVLEESNKNQGVKNFTLVTRPFNTQNIILREMISMRCMKCDLNEMRLNPREVRLNQTREN